MKKVTAVICIFMLMLSCITGCKRASGETNNYKAYTFAVETGDNVIVKLNISDKYDITSKIPFEVSKDGEVQSQGVFITAKDYDAYVESVSKDEKAKIIDSGKKDSCEYLMWNYNNTEFNYVILIENSNTGIVLGNNVSEKSAKECFERLEIRLK